MIFIIDRQPLSIIFLFSPPPYSTAASITTNRGENVASTSLTLSFIPDFKCGRFNVCLYKISRSEKVAPQTTFASNLKQPSPESHGTPPRTSFQSRVPVVWSYGRGGELKICLRKFYSIYFLSIVWWRRWPIVVVTVHFLVFFFSMNERWHLKY